MSHKNRELLTPFHRLDGLSLGNGSLENGGFEAIGRMTDLNWLDCTNSPVTNRDLLSLRGCPSLQFLGLRGTAVDDEGVAWLAQNLLELREVWLPMQISDVGVKALELMPKLESLGAYDCNITDQSLDTLERIKTLRTIYVGHTRISKTGLARFQRARPDVAVDAKP